MLDKAVAMQDALPYMEPPFWTNEIRPCLGAVMMTAKRYVEAEQGELWFEWLLSMEVVCMVWMPREQKCDTTPPHTHTHTRFAFLASLSTHNALARKIFVLHTRKDPPDHTQHNTTHTHTHTYTHIHAQ